MRAIPPRIRRAISSGSIVRPHQFQTQSSGPVETRRTGLTELNPRPTSGALRVNRRSSSRTARERRRRSSEPSRHRPDGPRATGPAGASEDTTGRIGIRRRGGLHPDRLLDPDPQAVRRLQIRQIRAVYRRAPLRERVERVRDRDGRDRTSTSTAVRAICCSVAGRPVYEATSASSVVDCSTVLTTASRGASETPGQRSGVRDGSHWLLSGTSRVAVHCSAPEVGGVLGARVVCRAL